MLNTIYQSRVRSTCCKGEKGKRRTAQRWNALLLLLFRITKYNSSARTHNYSTYPKNEHTFIVGIAKYAFIVDISKPVKEDFCL